MKYCEVLAFQQESMSENQISFLDIKIAKVGLDQSQNLYKLGKGFFL